jgi:hypothetical protein
LQPTAWPSSPGVKEDQEPTVGLEPTSTALRERRPARRASSASEQPVLVSSQLDRGSKPQSPPEGLARTPPPFVECGHSAPTWNRTRTSAFAGPRDIRFTIEAITDSGRIDQRKERELNPQGSSLARVRAGCRRQSACPSNGQSGWLDSNQRTPASDAGG